MKKTLGQNGLNFIAGKYKELRTALSNKVDKVQGKGLSTNDYDSTAKSKVDAIPTNPKYTDTTYDLSKYAEKSDISRCKTDGYNTSTVWGDISSTRDLEDWIGDFDKRTRELRNNKGLTGDKSEFQTDLITSQEDSNCKLLAVKWGRIVQLSFYYTYDQNRTPYTSWTFIIPKNFMPSVGHAGVISHGAYEILPNRDESDAKMTIEKSFQFVAGDISGDAVYFSRWQ